MTPEAIKAAVDSMAADNARQALKIDDLQRRLDEANNKYYAIYGHANRNADRIIAALRIFEADNRSHAALQAAVNDAVKALKGEA